MTDLDDAALWAGAAPALVVPKRCRRHVWGVTYQSDGREWTPCLRCDHVRNDTASRRGRTNRSRGNAIEREWCKRLGFRRVGQYGGPEDGVATNGLFVGQAKSMSTARFPGWMSDELARLPRAGGRIPVLGVLEAPGPGRHGRRLLIIDEADWVSLYGPNETW